MRSTLTFVYCLVVAVSALGCQGGSTPGTAAAETGVAAPETISSIAAETTDDEQPQVQSKRHHYRTPLAHHHLRHRQPVAR